MLYAVFGCAIVTADNCEPCGRMDLIGDPDVFETAEEAVDCAVTRHRHEEHKLCVIIELPDSGRPRPIAWYGLRPAVFALDFPGHREACVKQMDDVRERIENATYIPITGER